MDTVLVIIGRGPPAQNGASPRRVARKPRHHFRRDLLGERAGLALFGVKMQGLQRRLRDDLVRFVVAHHVNELRAFFLEPDQGRPHGDDVAGVQLSNLGNMLIDRGDAFGGAQVSWSRAEGVEELPDRLVELPNVPHDVHVADMIAVPGAVGAAIGDERLGRDVP